MDPIEVDSIWFRHHGFTKSIIFILGLIWSYMMVEKTFLDILITRLTIRWKAYGLRTSAIAVSSREAATILFIAAFSYATDVLRSRLGRFGMVAFSTIICIVGLVLYVSTETENKGQPNLWLFFYPAMGILALAQAGHKVTLRVFLEDQFRRVDRNENERRQITKFWWILVSVVAAIFAQLEPLTGLQFKTLALVLITVMFLFFLLFLGGFRCYNNEEIDDGSDGAPHQDIRQRIKKFLFWLWVSWSVLSLVSASGSTFFLLEATALVAHHDSLLAILFLANLVRITEVIASEASKRAVEKANERWGYNISNMELIKIGPGIGFCILCCNVANMTAENRMDDGGAMSVYWLTPQFFLLGLIRGIAKEGFRSVFESIVHDPRYKIYGGCLGVLTRGFGTLLSILCIYIFGSKYDLENSKLNSYYNILILFSWCNGVLYLILLLWYLGTWFLKEDAEMNKAYLEHKQKVG